MLSQESKRFIYEMGLDPEEVEYETLNRFGPDSTYQACLITCLVMLGKKIKKLEDANDQP